MRKFSVISSLTSRVRKFTGTPEPDVAPSGERRGETGAGKVAPPSSVAPPVAGAVTAPPFPPARPRRTTPLRAGPVRKTPIRARPAASTSTSASVDSPRRKR